MGLGILFQFRDDAQRLAVALETAPARYAAVQGHLSVMTGRRVSQILRQADCPDQCRIRKPFPDIVIVVPAMIVMQSVPDGLAYLADLQRVREAGAMGTALAGGIRGTPAE